MLRYISFLMFKNLIVVVDGLFLLDQEVDILQDRRKIEGDLFGGKLCGIAATNALELGIDVGHIDVTLHLGFPGSIAR